MATPNMGLVLPSPSVTPGPTYASQNNTAFEAIDEHDHTSGSGVQVPSAGLNINAALSFNDYALTDAGYLGLTLLDSAITTGAAKLFVYNGELYYRDNASNNVRLTLSGAVDAGATGAITGLTSPGSADYSTITETFTWTADTNEFAKMASADLLVYEYGAVSPNPITIKSPASVGSAYSITLPGAVPAATYPVTMTSAGVLGNSGTVQLAAGAAATPSLYFNGDTNTGLFSDTGDVLKITAGGATRVSVGSTTALAVTGAATVSTTLDVTGATTLASTLGVTGATTLTGAAACSSTLAVTGATTLSSTLQFGSAGAFKVSVYTGSLAASASTSVNVGSTVYGAIGWSSSNGSGSTMTPMIRNDGVTGVNSYIKFSSAQGGTNVVEWVNTDTDSTNTYKVVVFHA